jgi:hypothetical protein
LALTHSPTHSPCYILLHLGELLAEAFFLLCNVDKRFEGQINLHTLGKKKKIKLRT